MADEVEAIEAWFIGRVPAAWLALGAKPAVEADREEVVVVLPLAGPDRVDGASPEARAAARAGWVQQFRETTRAERVQVAREAEHRFGRKVSWGVEVDGERELFTTFSAPVMTRLRMEQRAVLDALVAAGVARSRSHALDWCVRLVGRHQGDWIDELREALTHVARVRASGPDAG